MSQHWTVDNIPDLSGKIIIVTGANSGIGYESALEFARKHATVILACRSMDKAQQALADIKAQIPNAKAEIMQLDLASQKSVHAFADAFKAKYDRLDILLNNAGIMMSPYGVTEDGFERQMGTNHLGHFALTGLLMDVILKTPQARVVNVSSNAHTSGKMDFDNLLYENGKDYSPITAYGRSKLSNLLFTHELQRYFEQKGVDAIAASAHPGGSNTNLAHYLEERWYVRMLMPLASILMQSAAMGALPSIRACVDPNVKGGEYYGPGGFQEVRGYPVKVESNAASHNQADAKKLWQVSEELTGVHYP